MRKIIIPIFCLFAIASLLRLWRLERPDINPDESHYISDAVRLSHDDPYISIRYHTFKHPEPSIGHPFLAQIIGANFFKIFGYSNFTARLPQALAGVLTVIVLLLFNNKLGKKVAFTSAFLLAIIPFAVRYSRDAHLDSIFALFTTLVALFIWRYHSSRNYIWLVFSGVAVGLAISTKIDGLLALILAFLLLFSLSLNSKLFTFGGFGDLLKNISIILVPSILVAFLLNDPLSYLEAIMNPSDPNYSLTSLNFWISALGRYKFWGQVAFYLITPILLIFWVCSLVYLVRKNDSAAKFLIIWQLTLLPLIFLHRPGLSGQYGLLPIVPAMAISMSYFISKLDCKKLLLAVLLLIFSALPFTRLYGLYLKPLPYYTGETVWTRTLGDNFYLKIVEQVNKLAPEDGKVFLLPQTNYPIFSLRPDISWTYSERETSNVLVVSKPELVGKDRDNIKFLKSYSQYQDGEELTRYIFVRD